MIYELHVGGFTTPDFRASAGEKRGTFAGLVEKIPYLQDLGITAVELLSSFNSMSRTAAPGLHNYWGYSPGLLLCPPPGIWIVAKSPNGTG